MADLLRVLVRLIVSVLVVIAAIAGFAVLAVIGLVLQFREDLLRMVGDGTSPIHPKGETRSAEVVPFAKKTPEVALRGKDRMDHERDGRL